MISVIIPAYNEESYIKATIKAVRKQDTGHLIKEIIVADGGSKENTVSAAIAEKVKIVSCPKKGRAAQMNYGASFATGNIFYFLHADTIPPPDFTREIVRVVNQGIQAGCFMLSFDDPHWFLRVNCWFTRFDVDVFRFGDQSLFAAKSKFWEVGGFCETHMVLEDQHMIKKLKRVTRFQVIQKAVLTSARKYLANGLYKTQAVFFLIYLMYRLGFSQQRLVNTYRALIRQEHPG